MKCSRTRPRARRTRDKVQRRLPLKRLTYGARRFRVFFDPELPFVCEVRIARSPRRMVDEMRRLEGERCARVNADAKGVVRSWTGKLTGWPAVRPTGIICRMYLNERSLRQRPSEIVAHECGHAAMAWARFQRANLHVMPGEEVMCYALGRLVRQVNAVCYAHGVW